MDHVPGDPQGARDDGGEDVRAGGARPAVALRFTPLRTPAFAALLAQLGCGGTPVAPDDALAQAEHRWQQAAGNADRYVMRQQRLCYCLTRDTMRVTVSAGRISSIVNERTGAATPAEEFGSYRTVAQLFAEIRALPSRGGRVLDVRYHPAQGYPERLATDPIPAAADDEVTWVTMAVVPGG